MITWHLFVLLVAGVMMTSEAASLPVRAKKGNKFCGANLVDALFLACEELGYRPLFISGSGKRGSGHTSMNSVVEKVQANILQSYQNFHPKPRRLQPLRQWPLPSMILRRPFLSPHKAHMFLKKRSHYQRVARGAYDECCQQSCDYNELRGYCDIL